MHFFDLHCDKLIFETFRGNFEIQCQKSKIRLLLSLFLWHPTFKYGNKFEQCCIQGFLNFILLKYYHKIYKRYNVE